MSIFHSDRWLSRRPNIHGESTIKFLITGLPRCRTAWLSAVMCAHGSPCIHDAIIRDCPEGWGISDPGAATVYPDSALLALGDAPLVIVTCRQLDSRVSFEKEFGNVSDQSWNVMMQNYLMFKAMVDTRANTLFVPVEELSDDETVGEIVKLCTKQEPSLEIISTFQLLQITQNLTEAERRLSSRTGPSKLMASSKT